MIQTPIQITARGFLLAAWWKDAISKKIEKLGAFHDRITSCRVVIEAPPKHHRKGRLYEVRLDIEVPGGFIVVDRESSPTLDETLERTFDAAARRLEDFARRRRGEPRPLRRGGGRPRSAGEHGQGSDAGAASRKAKEVHLRKRLGLTLDRFSQITGLSRNAIGPTAPSGTRESRARPGS
jgi:hypothetical protein